MILTADIGNTTIAISVVEQIINSDGSKEYNVLSTVKISSHETLDACQYASIVTEHFIGLGINPKEANGAIISSVVPSLTDIISDVLYNITGKVAQKVSTRSDSSMIYDIHYPEKLGQDRIVDSAYAAFAYELPVITVDMGSATTINVINKEHVFMGGMICPGIETGLDMMCSRGALLPDVKPMVPANIIGKDTVECLISGSVYGAAAMVDGVVSYVEKMLGTKVTVIMTGGLAGLAHNLCNCRHVYDPEHLTKGLAYLYNINNDIC